MATEERLLTPSKITAWLDCAHYLTLRNQVDDGSLRMPSQPFGSFARLLLDKGMQHEGACLSEYREEGLSIFEVPKRTPGETFTDWVERIGNPLEAGYDVIYQMPFVHDGIRGIADFLVRVDDPVQGHCAYEPIDAKLARLEAKPGHVLQLCFYAEALEALTGLPPRQLHLWLGSGDVEPLESAHFRPYWRRLRSQLKALVTDGHLGAPTAPEPNDHCGFCEFAELCEGVWRDEDSLIYVAGIRRADRDGLGAAGVETLGELAVRQDPVELIRPERLERLAEQASLQVDARTDPNSDPPYRTIQPDRDPTWGRGFELMPEPDDWDVYLDFEGDPFWRTDVGLFFLFGLITKSGDHWDYRAFWAHDRAQEAAATHDLIEFLSARRSAHEGMHVYHYNHTERSALERLAADHGVGEVALASLVDTGLFVDLLPVVRNAVQVGIESYGLKQMERVTGYQRSHEIDRGSGAVVEYEKFMVHGEQPSLDRIAAYNEDDVRSTLALRDWLVALRPRDMPWRVAVLVSQEVYPELDAQISALHAFGQGTPEQLLGELLGYWLRERSANKAPKLAKTALDVPILLDDPEVLAGLQFLGDVPRVGKNGKAITPAKHFRWPDQTLDDDFGAGMSHLVLYSTESGQTGYAQVLDLDLNAREVLLLWSARSQELATIPSVVVNDDWVPARPKPETLSELAARVLDPSTHGHPNRASMALLRGDQPVVESGNGPPNGRFGDEVNEITAWAPYLDHSYVAIQGPPGTGKTFRGAHIVHALIGAGRRVGITAMSHHAIDNLLAEILNVFADAGHTDALKALRRGSEPAGGGLPGVTYTDKNRDCARGNFNLIAGTTWLFSNEEMRSAPVDTLIIDEAGQLALADAMAASTSAKNLILLGDPLQLPQVSQASHPGGGGLSVLEHVLDGDVTIPSDRGVFLTETRRMHPDVCRFISEEIYEGRLHSHPSCAIQNTEFGTGLRWLRAEHTDCSTESSVEADIVVEALGRLIRTNWINQHGVKSPLAVADFMVVAPYNDQVDLLRARLDNEPLLRGIRVGTVDKFQGQEAAVVIFTMTTSSSVDIPRGPGFLFSRNRLNVAISRARCLAYLVCTEELLNSRARTVEEMRLISTLCAFVEHSDPPREVDVSL
jgi:predicted RecB family nuclease